MPVLRTKAIHDISHMVQAREYVQNEEKTRMSNNEERTHLDNAFTYAQNPFKTELDGDSDLLVRGHLCTPATAQEQFALLQEQYEAIHGKEKVRYGINKHGEKVEKQAVIAYHMVLSFPKYYEIDPRLANQIGLELLDKMPGNYPGIVCTHMNTHCIHDHILLCNYSVDDAKKIPMTKAYREELRKISDEIALKYDIPIILERGDKARNVSWYEKEQAKRGQSWKQVIRDDINIYKAISKDWNEFKGYMTDAGYKIDDSKKYAVYQPPGADYRMRCSERTLGEEYTRQALFPDDNIDQTVAKEAPVQPQRTPIDPALDAHRKHKSKIYVSRYADNGRRRSDLERMLLFAIKAIKKVKDKYFDAAHAEDNSPVYRTTAEKIEMMAQSLNMVRKEGYETVKDVQSAREATGVKLGQLKSQLKDAKAVCDTYLNLTKTLQDLDELQIIVDSIDNFTSEDMYLDTLTADQIRKNRAQAFPMTASDRKELWKAINDNPDYTIKGKWEDISTMEARQIISYLHDTSANVQPDSLMDAEQAVRYRIDNRRKNMDAAIRRKLDIPVSEGRLRQIAKIQEKHPELPRPMITKEYEAVQYINAYDEKRQTNPFASGLMDAQEKMQIEALLARYGLYINRDIGTVTKSEGKEIYQYTQKGMTGYIPPILSASEPVSAKDIQQIKEMLDYRDESIPFPVEKLSDASAKALSSYLLYKDETPSFMTAEIPSDIQVNARKFKDRINNKGYSGQEIAYIGMYRDALNYLNSIGIDVKDIPGLKQQIVDNIAKMNSLESDVEALGKKYKDLSKLEINLNLAGNDKFVYGPKYEEKTDEKIEMEVTQEKDMEQEKEDKEIEAEIKKHDKSDKIDRKRSDYFARNRYYDRVDMDL